MFSRWPGEATQPSTKVDATTELLYPLIPAVFSPYDEYPFAKVAFALLWALSWFVLIAPPGVAIEI